MKVRIYSLKEVIGKVKIWKYSITSSCRTIRDDELARERYGVKFEIISRGSGWYKAREIWNNKYADELFIEESEE